MRPFTAESNGISLPATIRWKNKSTSPKNSSVFDQKQLRHLIETNNVKLFIAEPSVKLEADNMSSIKALNRTEVLSQLKILKSNFNYTKKRFSMGDSELRDLQKLSKEKALEQKVGTSRLHYLDERIQSLDKAINNTKKKQEEAENSMQIYFHILGRSRKTQIFLEMRANKLRNKIQKQNFILESEERLNLKSRKSKTCSQKTYKLLYSTFVSDTKEKYNIVERVSKNIELRDILNGRREERKTRLLEISEIAANEHNDKHGNHLREGLMLGKLWFNYLSDKLGSEIKKFSAVELAFQKIRAVTGEYNISEIVHKFLTREQTFKELKLTIDSSRVAVETLYHKNSDIEKMIKTFTIYDRESRTANIFNLKEIFNSKSKDLENENFKLKLIKSIYERILEWNKKMLKLLGVEGTTPNNLRELFVLLSSAIKNSNLLKPVVSKL
jgi:hypothetical protein